MRDGIITMLSGNLRSDWRSRGPILALKSAYYLLSLQHRLGRKGDAAILPAQGAARYSFLIRNLIT
jgi:hypothetical protein